MPERLRTSRILQTDQISKQDFGPRGDSLLERLLKSALNPCGVRFLRYSHLFSTLNDDKLAKY